MNIIFILCMYIFQATIFNVQGNEPPRIAAADPVPHADDDDDEDSLNGSQDDSTPIHKKKFTLPPVIVGNSTGNAEGKPHKLPLRIIVYHSLNCPHCKLFKTEKLAELKKKYVDTNQVYFEFVDFPINWLSVQAAKLAWCKKDVESHGKFEHIIVENFKIDAIPVESDWVFSPKPSNQLVVLLEKSLERPKDIADVEYMASLRSIAALIDLLGKRGLTVSECINCLNDKALDDSIVNPAFLAQKNYHLDYAPGFLINNEMVDMEKLDAKIDKALAKIKK